MIQADIQLAAPKPVQLIVVEAVTHSMDPVYMGVLILTLSQSTALVRKQEGIFLITFLLFNSDDHFVKYMVM